MILSEKQISLSSLQYTGQCRMTTGRTLLHLEHCHLIAGKQWCPIAAVYLGVYSNPNKDYSKAYRSLF